MALIPGTLRLILLGLTVALSPRAVDRDGIVLAFPALGGFPKRT